MKRQRLTRSREIAERHDHADGRTEIFVPHCGALVYRVNQAETWCVSVLGSRFQRTMSLKSAVAMLDAAVLERGPIPILPEVKGGKHKKIQLRGEADRTEAAQLAAARVPETLANFFKGVEAKPKGSA